MSKRNLYPTMSNIQKNYSIKYLDFLQYSDGKNDIEDISRKIKLNKNKCLKILKILNSKKIINL